MTAGDPRHLSPEDVAAFLDHGLAGSQRDRVEAHLADCDDCRAEIIDVGRTVRARPVRRGKRFIPLGLAAAAAIAFVVLNIQRGPEDSVDRVRTPAASSPADAFVRIDVLFPADGDTIRLARPALAWSAVTGEPTYRLTVTDASGETLWTSTTTDTTLTLPAQVLHPGASYFWYVDALRADGRAASTGVRSFKTP